MLRTILVMLALLVPASAGHAAPSSWTVEWLVGAAWNARNQLEIQQAGFDDLAFDARFATRPFEQPLYWAARVSHQQGTRAWSLELHHHKLVLEDAPSEVESFTVTHGTNILSLQHAWLRPHWRWFVLAGVVAAHPENTVRGRRLPEGGGWFDAGYHLAGPALGLGVGTHLPLTGWLELTLEGRLVVAWLELDVVDGRADHTNVGGHLLVGPRVRF